MDPQGSHMPVWNKGKIVPSHRNAVQHKLMKKVKASHDRKILKHPVHDSLVHECPAGNDPKAADYTPKLPRSQPD